MRLLIPICILLIASSCAGYRYYEKSNPFSIYGIKSIYIPAFYNHSNLSNASHAFTKEFFILMSQFRGLKIENNEDKADAVLIGIIASPKKINETMINSGLRGAKSVAPKAIGDKRQDFYVPASNLINLTLRVTVLKRPSKEEIDFFQSNLSTQVSPTGKIIFNESIALRKSFNREYFDEDGSKVNATLNRGALKNTVELMAIDASENFRNMILYAF